MAIYALTLTWNAKNCLEALYKSFLQMQKNTKGDIIWFIKDNDSKDDTEALVKSWNNELYVRYFKMDHNLDNYAKGNNFLVEKVKEQENINYDKDYFLFLNNDITIDDPHSLSYMLDIMDRDKNVGVVGARLFYPGGKKFIQHAGVVMSVKHNSMPWHIFAKEYDSKFTNQNKEYQAVTGAFLLIRANCFKNLQFGKMDERYSWAFDDITMCLDVKYFQNKKVVYCGKTNISHYESLSISKNKCNIMFMKHNVDLFKKQWGKKYRLDYYDYINDPNFNLYKG